MAEHVGSDDLTTIALDDRDPSGPEDAHLRRCTACAEELSALRSVARRGRESVMTDLGALEPPGEHVWRRIAAALELPPAGQQQGTAEDPTANSGATVLSLDRRRSPSRSKPGWLGLAAAMVLLAVAAGATVVALRGQSSELTAVQLAALGDDTTAARVRLLERDGHRELALELPGRVAGSGEYLEVWLIDDTVQRMVSLGAVRPDDARVRVPDGLDLATYPIVDVSREPLDGDPLHSGDSIWRGRLGTPS